jgi:hypothetical protein
VLALAGCGRQLAAGPPSGSGDLAAYVIADGGGTQADAGSGARAGDSSKGSKAYRAPVFLVSSDTGTPVQQITASCGRAAPWPTWPGRRPEVRAQAAGLIQARLKFAVANGRLTAMWPSGTAGRWPPPSTP